MSCVDCDRAARWERGGREARLAQIAELQRRILTTESEIRELERIVERADVEVAEHRRTEHQR